MRFLAALVLVLSISSATATWTLVRKKTYGVACQVPINQLACRLDSNNHVQGLYYGGWGDNQAFTDYASANHVDYIQGPGGFWYTQNWCSSWGFLSRCVGGYSLPTPADKGRIVPVGGGTPFPDNGFTPPGTFTIEYVTAMRVCYTAGKKASAIARIEWDTQKYDASWVSGGTTTPPMSQVVVVPGGGRTVGCGRPDPTCAFQAEWKAPAGKVLGGIYAKCKYTQGFDKFWSTGLYKPRYYLKSIDKACAVFPTPPPTGKFLLCDAALCPNGPNDDNGGDCPDFGTYQCTFSPCKKK
jgi:hypothetical protein